jgi:glycosyltransferase involved in cell wall biosynthesis
MRILLIMNPGLPVPPKLYGGVERIVYILAEEYIRLGHEVTLLAAPGSYCSGKTVIFGADGNKEAKWGGFKEFAFVWKFLLKNHNDFDLIHNFGRLIYLFPILNKHVFKLMSYQRPVTVRGIKLITSLPNKNLIFTACSDNCAATGAIKGIWKTVYNAIKFSDYQLTEQLSTDAPLMFLGRLDRVKGAHIAIRVAKETNSKLVIAGNISETPDNYEYYQNELEPQFDGRQIFYIGPVNDHQKNEYLGKAKALLFPIEWDEPFGIVMIEAMACGTPVIGFNRGSVPEVLTRETGIKVNTAEEMITAVHAVDNIERKVCRETGMKRFDISVIANEYLKLLHEF